MLTRRTAIALAGMTLAEAAAGYYWVTIVQPAR